MKEINKILDYTNEKILLKYSNDYGKSTSEAKNYFHELKKFLYICSISKEPLAPSKEIDNIWHTFILFSKDYRNFCSIYLNATIDHTPEVEGLTSEHNLEICYKNSLKLLRRNFGSINKEIWGIKSVGDCTFTGNCFNCTSEGTSCVGENPNDL